MASLLVLKLNLSGVFVKFLNINYPSRKLGSGDTHAKGDSPFILGEQLTCVIKSTCFFQYVAILFEHDIKRVLINPLS